MAERRSGNLAKVRLFEQALKERTEQLNAAIGNNPATDRDSD